jgi:Tfp pilus assembly protein PilE
MPKHKTNKKRFFTRSKMKLIIVLVVVLLLGQLTLDGFVIKNFVYPDAAVSSELLISSLLTNGVSQLNKPAPVDPMTGDIYFPDAHLMMPPYPELGQVEYDYDTRSQPYVLHITTSNIISAAQTKLLTAQATAEDYHAVNQKYVLRSVFDQVPNLQACARGIQLFYQTVNYGSGSDYVLQASKKLTNGKTIYIYTEDGCKQDVSQIVSYVKQIQSY